MVREKSVIFLHEGKKKPKNGEKDRSSLVTIVLNSEGEKINFGVNNLTLWLFCMVENKMLYNTAFLTDKATDATCINSIFDINKEKA